MRLALSTIALVACTSLASAADLGGPYGYDGSVKDGPVAASYNWSGLYLGGHVGWATGEWDGSLRTAGQKPEDLWHNPNQSYDFDGWLGGLQVGFNRQHGSIVWGLEADASWGDLEGSKDVLTKPEATIWSDAFSVDAFGTVRGRLGFLVTPRILFYGTGGLAWARTSLAHTVYNNEGIVPPPMSAKASADEYHLGWTAGAGAEIMLGGNWTVRGEWLRIDLGEAHYHPTGPTYDIHTGEPDGGTLRSDTINDVDLAFDVFRLGVNYKFGP